MKKIIYIGILSVLSASVYAVPNVWDTNLRQGGYNVFISDANNNELDFGCMLEDPPKWHNLSVTYKGKTIETHRSLSFLLDNKKVYKPLPTAQGHVATTHWNNFLSAIPYAKKIEVYNNNKFLFVLYPRNGVAEITEIEVCSL
jgi:hypothetical protein